MRHVCRASQAAVFDAPRRRSRRRASARDARRVHRCVARARGLELGRDAAEVRGVIDDTIKVAGAQAQALQALAQAAAAR